MVDNRSGVATGGASSAVKSNEGSRGRGKLGIWPWVVAALLLLGGLTAIDLAFYRGDAHHEEEVHEEGEHDEEGVEELETTG